MTPYKYVKNCWYVVGLSHEFKPNSLSGHKIAGQSILIWRTQQGKAVAFDNRCCHKRFPLSEGRLMEDGTLECAYHGLRYNEDGKCVLIPSQAESPIPKHARAKPFPIKEQDGMVVNKDYAWFGNDGESAMTQDPGSDVALSGNDDESESDSALVGSE